MELRIDGNLTRVVPGKSLRELIIELGLDTADLSTRPLAARIAGEVFTLNYIPVRVKDAQGNTINTRTAMAASGGEIRLLRYSDPAGKDTYVRTAQFVIFLALNNLWPEAQVKMSCTLGPGLFISVKKAIDFSVARLKTEIMRIVQADIPLMRRRVTTNDAFIMLCRAACTRM